MDVAQRRQGFVLGKIHVVSLAPSFVVQKVKRGGKKGFQDAAVFFEKQYAHRVHSLCEGKRASPVLVNSSGDGPPQGGPGVRVSPRGTSGLRRLGPA